MATQKRRPYKFTETRRQKYLALLARGVRRYAAAKSVGLDPGTIVDTINAEPEFAAAVEDAECRMHDAVENSLFKAATQDRNVTAIMFYLQNRRPDEWQDRRNVNLSGHLNVGVTDEKIDAELQRLLESRGGQSKKRAAKSEAKSERVHEGNGHSGNGKK